MHTKYVGIVVVIDSLFTRNTYMLWSFAIERFVQKLI